MNSSYWETNMKTRALLACLSKNNHNFFHKKCGIVNKLPANIASKLYETLPIIMIGAHNLRTEKDGCKLAATAIVAAGLGGDMDEKLAYEPLDDMDFHYNKVKCRKIEGMMPKLMKMVEMEMKGLEGMR